MDENQAMIVLWCGRSTNFKHLHFTVAQHSQTLDINLNVALAIPATSSNWSCEVAVIIGPIDQSTRLEIPKSHQLLFNAANSVQKIADSRAQQNPFYLLVKLHSQEKSKIGLEEILPRLTDQDVARQFNTDTRLILDDSEVPIFVHRHFLATQSRMFKVLFEGDWKEKAKQEILIHDVALEQFTVFLAHLYHPMMPIKKQDLSFLMTLSDRFDCTALMARCRKFISNSKPTLASEFKLLIQLADRYRHQQAVFEVVDKMSFLAATALLDKDFLDSLSASTVTAIYARVQLTAPR